MRKEAQVTIDGTLIGDDAVMLIRLAVSDMAAALEALPGAPKKNSLELAKAILALLEEGRDHP